MLNILIVSRVLFTPCLVVWYCLACNKIGKANVHNTLVTNGNGLSCSQWEYVATFTELGGLESWSHMPPNTDGVTVIT